jgi:starch synthase
VPIVRETGGLDDTITDLTPQTLAAGKANGFSFSEYSASALEATLHRAISVFHHQPEVWQTMVAIGMRQDWSWNNSARRYVDLYRGMLSARDASRARIEGLR